jgi:hypothetical protein
MDASSTPLAAALGDLAPADRALVELWAGRGLDDDRLAALTAVAPEAVRTRRERILRELAAATDLPEAEIAAGLQATLAAPAPDSEPRVDPGDAAVEPAPASPMPAAPPQPRGRRGWWAALIALGGAAVAVLLVVLLSGGSGSSPANGAVAADRGSTPASATTPSPRTTSTAGADPPPTTTATTTATVTAPTVRIPRPPTLGAFAGLPGGLRHGSGRAVLLGQGRELRLRLRVSGLPRARPGDHYEAWLYTTVLSSQALGRVRPGRTSTFRLPADAARFRFIDISLQRRGEVNHSGESRLRTANPVRALRHGAAPAARHRVLHPARAAAHRRTGSAPRGRPRHRPSRSRARSHPRAHDRSHPAPTRHGHRAAQRRGSDSRTRRTR